MANIRYRRRGTAIVETEKGILLTAGRHGKPFILPGGGAEKGESRLIAALRELTEETHLLPYYAEVIFKHTGKVRPTISGKHKFQDHHTVCVIKANGHPKPGGGDAKRIGYYSPGGDVWISKTTREIIEKYYAWKKEREKLLGKLFSVNISMNDDDDDAEDVRIDDIDLNDDND